MSQSSTSSVVAVDALLVRDVDGQYRPALAEEVLSQARRVLSQRVRRGATMSSPQAVKDYLLLEIGVLEHEVFCVLFLDAQHRIIALKQMFRGTVTQTSVYPREVVKEALAVNAAAVILAHSVARHRMSLMCHEPLCAEPLYRSASARERRCPRTHNAPVKLSMPSPSTSQTGDCHAGTSLPSPHHGRPDPSTLAGPAD
jgi:DNA repair protein RadC